MHEKRLKDLVQKAQSNQGSVECKRIPSYLELQMLIQLPYEQFKPSAASKP
jgi:hypothetical protein